MKRVATLAFCSLVILAAMHAAAPASAAATSSAQAKPNIVILLADDLGWTDIHAGATSGGNGSTYYQTPAIDRLTAQGMSFSSMYMCPNCAPARAALMTGQSAVHNGVYNVTSLSRGTGVLEPPQQSKYIRHDAVTIAETLKAAGYSTCQVGKYHVSMHDDITKYDGFDFNYGGGKAGDGSPHGYFAVRKRAHWTFIALGPEMNAFAEPYTKEYVEKNLLPFANGNDPSKLSGTAKHLTDADADAAIDFMSKHLDSAKDKGKPFFINIAFNAVHVAVRARPDLLAKYEKLKSTDPRHTHADYAALIEGEDQAIARVLAFLDERKIVGHTLVIFLSDNGGFAGSTNNAPLRGSKGVFYEGAACACHSSCAGRA